MILIGISCAFAVAIFLYFGKKAAQYQVDLKSYPKKYAYQKLKDGEASIVFVGEDTACIKKIRKFHEDFYNGIESNIPGCFTHSLPVNSVVHVVQDDTNADFVHIAYFYIGKRNMEQYFTGYVLRSMLHDKPI